MPSTVQELSARTDAMRDELSTRLDSLRDKVDAGNENLNTKITTNSQDILLVQTQITQAISIVQKELANLQGLISGAKLISIATTLIVTALLAVVSVIGGTKIWQSQSEFEKQTSQITQLKKDGDAVLERADKQAANYSRMMRDSLIEKIEVQLNSEGSVDHLDKAPLTVFLIEKLARDLEEQNQFLPDKEKSSYFKISRALHFFIQHQWGSSLRELDGISGNDEEHFAYLYMKSACLVRTNKPSEAIPFLLRLQNLTQGKQLQMSRSAMALTRLAIWKVSKDSDQATALKSLNDATSEFETLTREYPNFLNSYTNLACAYSVQRNYTKVTETLIALREKMGSAFVADDIQTDMTNGDQYFTNFVNEILKPKANLNSVEWVREVSTMIDKLKS